MDLIYGLGAIAITFLIVRLFISLNRIEKSQDILESIQDDTRVLIRKLKEIEKQLDKDKSPEPVIEEPAPPIPEVSLEQRIENLIQDAAAEIKHEETVEIIDETEENIDKENLVLQFEAVPSARKETPVSATATADFVKMHDNKSDLEKYIGENVVNKIGIGILVIGIGYFVKYAIDKNWINETFRTLIGIACGGLLIGIGHRLHRKFMAFSSVLFGGGLAVFYLTISIAFHQYHLFSQTVAFGIMVLITCFAILLSLKYDRKEVAVIGVLGGFGTPLFLSTGEGNYIVLFSYLLILNVGMLILASLRKWPLLNIICYACTVIIYGAWYSDHNFLENPGHYIGALVFASAFYLTFFMMNILYNLKEKKKFKALDFSILLGNSFLYYWVGMVILRQLENGKYQGLFTASLSVFNLVFAWMLYSNKKADRSFVFMLIGLVIAFVSLTGPVQLHGHYITMYWATQAVLMLWLSQKSGLKMLKYGSSLITSLMLISLVMDWFDIYGHITYTNRISEHLPILINKGFVTGLFSLISIGVAIVFIRKEKDEFFPGFEAKIYINIFRILFILLLYLVPLIELVYQLNYYLTEFSEQQMVISLYNFVFVAGFYISGLPKKDQTVKGIFTISGFISLICFVLLYHNYDNHFMNIVSSEKPAMLPVYYAIHFPVLALVCLILFFTSKSALSLAGSQNSYKIPMYWFISLMIVYIASFEEFAIFYTSLSAFHYDAWQIEKGIYKIGFPITWAIIAFLIMRSGMLRKNRSLRIISLTILLITVLKLFIFDISDASEVGKIIAFICLGIVLLVISFMYQRIKNLLFKDDQELAGEEGNS
jgi:uncharacterized membrane protein